MIDKVGIRLKVKNINLVSKIINDLLKDKKRNNYLHKLKKESIFNYLQSGEFIAETLIELCMELDK